CARSYDGYSWFAYW
nr:immunoglobulin heavy chain junction region [Mus musculus]MBK4189751.1 immunoglobulin heavy chain junction region [Mus musculus]